MGIHIPFNSHYGYTNTRYPSHSTVTMGIQIQDVLVIQLSLWVYKYNGQDVLVILQSLWVYKYNRQDVLVILQSLRVYKYNRRDVLVILQSLWVYEYDRQDVLQLTDILVVKCPVLHCQAVELQYTWGLSVG